MPLGRLLLRQWFVLALVAVLVLGATLARSESRGADPSVVARLADVKLLRQLVVAGVMFVMAWPVPTRELLQTLRAPWAALVATAINIGLLPPVAFGLAQLGHPELGLGLIIVGSIPSTLASGAVWTRRAGGNDATAILVTLITNGTCFIVAPMWLTLLTGRQLQGQLDVVPMIRELVLLVVTPMAAGQLLRLSADLSAWATRHKWTLAVTAQVGILWMVFVGALQCGRQIYGLSAEPLANAPPTAAEMALMLTSVVAMHLGAFAVGWVVSRRLGFARPDCIAVGIAGSQKTLMIGLQLAITHYGGFSILPLVAYHVLQLLIDAMLAEWLRPKD
ncbi:MAG: bile acid:sodium symporter [Pirellulales bacterium]